jgi:galactofuranosylgalactofuranosylrhamnosyl-N-acetylglucosaminyl-diphospho-decaprenol beta-1,5/1,6-galactofuranosyltransferase
VSNSNLLAKVIFPDAGDPDVIPLYLDADEWTELRQELRPDSRMVQHRRGPIPKEVHASPLRISHINAVTMVTGRRSIVIPSGSRVSLGTYFNAFPASYWQRWTRLDGVRLSVRTSGPGDVTVYRSNARGVVQTVATTRVHGEESTDFDLKLDNFLDGGWYWFDLISRGEPLTLVEADWLAPDSSSTAIEPVGNVTISITTLNRTAYCLAVLESIGADPDTLSILDEVLVVDQGTDRIRAHDSFERADAALDGRLRVIEQANVGGSGGFSRGMLETVEAGRSDFLLLLDDDVAVEPESIRRAHAFASRCVEPTIVGGHMFDMYDRTKLHAYAESVDRWNFMWGPITPDRHDFTSSNLRQTRWMHRRYDVDYNGWWMSMIPVRVIREIGLSLPVFIKWDDAEYSLRAADHGFRTVSLPGAAIWHVSWVDKDDSRDWQAFFHARNRLIAALTHSPFAKGGRLPISNLAADVRHMLTLDYYAVWLRQLAYQSVLDGPETLHPEMKSRLPDIRSHAGEFRETTLNRDPFAYNSFPATAYFGDDPGADGSRPVGRSAIAFAVRNSWRHWTKPVPPASADHPQSHLPHGTPWWKLPALDSFALSNAEGSGVNWHLRDPKRFRSLLVSSIRSNLRIRRRWSKLSRTYREAIPQITSPEQWRASLGLDATDDR